VTIPLGQVPDATGGGRSQLHQELGSPLKDECHLVDTATKLHHDPQGRLIALFALPPLQPARRLPKGRQRATGYFYRKWRHCHRTRRHDEANGQQRPRVAEAFERMVDWTVGTSTLLFHDCYFWMESAISEP
jgi:hypothetical protein